MSDLTERLANLSPAKRALLQRYLLEKSANAVSQIIPRRTIKGPVPLSFAQQRLWFLHYLEPHSPVYNASAAFRLSGNLNVAVLEQSINAIVQRHEVLRTTFPAHDGQPLQMIAPHLYIPLSVTNLETLDHDACEAQALLMTASESQRPFDLAQGPLLRTSLLCLNEQEYIFLLSLHHIIADGWSIAILLRELLEFYTEFSKQQPSSAPELPIQYADYALWQRQWLQGAVLNRQLSWWKRQIGGQSPLLELPSDRVRPAVQTYRGASCDRTFSLELLAALKALSQREGVTLFMTLLGAFQTVLYRYTGRTNILVGSPIAGRTHSELEDLIGCFINTLVLRTDMSGNPTFRELLSRIRKNTLDAYAYQDLPFEMLVEELQPERSLSYAPIVQVMFALQNAEPQLQLPSLSSYPIKIDSCTSRVDVLLLMGDNEDGLTAFLEYSTDLFDASTMFRLLGHLETVLKSIVSQPDLPIDMLPMLTEIEQQALVSWNATNVIYSDRNCIQHLFEAQVMRSPRAIAVVFEGQQLTYDELNNRANQLARHLQKQGVGPEVLVGVCMERSLEMVIALLGVLKAGAAYVPLDPTYPRERIFSLLEDAQVSILLTQTHLLNHLPSLKGITIVELDRHDWYTVDYPYEENQESDVHLDDQAYMIYTSGSTGKPKGVMNTHRGICNRLLWMQQTYQLTAEDCVLQKTPFSFDVSVWEFFWPLITGARLVLARPNGHQDPTYLISLIADQQITTLHFVPSMLYAFLDETDLAPCKSLKRVICSGEALPLDLQERFFSRLNCSLYNLYGPTEAAVDVTYEECQSGAYENAVPIGRPIANIAISILDHAMQRVPVGVPGEIYIGGVGVARGYFNCPDLTAEKFIPDPFSAESGARLFKTGDLARYKADGAIEFLGRIDQQVKIRGFRIEPGEIKATLAQLPSIKETVVVAREDISGGKRLTAYLVPDQGNSTISIEAAYDYLRNKLPYYMVPSAILFLKELPLLPNGKVDRKALPAPDTAQPELQKAFVPPYTHIEEQLARIWVETLGIERVGIHDNFFEVGGHSLLAIQVVAKTRKYFSIELSLRSLFEAPTIAAFAWQVEISVGDRPDLQAPLIRPAHRDSNIPLSYAQQRLWFLEQLEPGSPIHHVPTAVWLNGPLDVKALEKSINVLVQRHEALRTTFSHTHGLPVQVVMPELTLPLTLIDLTSVPPEYREQEALQLAKEEAICPFDLQRGPLLRVCLLRSGKQDHLLLLVVHHLVIDGWSLNVLYQELSALYTANVQHASVSLPELPIQYADYAIWQRHWFSKTLLDSLAAYWQRQLAGMPASIDLPFNYPRPDARTFRGAGLSFVLSDQLTKELMVFSQQEGVTLFMILLAAYQVLLHRYSNQTDIVIGTDTANRDRAEIGGLIGFFTNQVVLRNSLADDPTVHELLERVRTVALGAYEHQELPFDRLVELLNPQRGRNNAPLFQVKIVFQRVSQQTLVLPGLTVRPVELHNPCTQIDLTLFLNETERGLSGSLLYNADRFDSTTAKNIVEYYKTLLMSMVSQPQARLSMLPMATEAERGRHITDHNKRQERLRSSFKAVKPKTVSLSQQDIYRQRKAEEESPE